MHVDATDVPGSSILAIVVTLASVALLSYSLRLYTHGRLPRSLGTDDWLLLVAALCVIGVAVITIVLRRDLGRQEWLTTTDDDPTMSPLGWGTTLFSILGIGFIKLSVAFTVLKLAPRNWHRHTILGFICLTTVLTVIWFGSALLFGGPITVNWSSTKDLKTTCGLLGFINSILDATTVILVALLPFPVFWTSRPDLPVKLGLLMIYSFTIVVVAAAIVRSYLLHDTWKNQDANSPISSIILWSSIELTLGMLAACLFTLQPLASSINCCLCPGRSKLIPASSVSTPHYFLSQAYASTDTVIHRPSAIHPLSLRFHDDESNLDFDIEPPNNRTRTHTLRSRGTHSRNLSDWSQFSGFTYYTTTAVSAYEASPRRSRVVSMNEMEVRTKNIAVGKAGVDNANIGVAITTLHNKPVRESETGEEMAELARLFADNSKDWGTEAFGSARTSTVVDSTRTSRQKHDYTL